MTKEEIIVKIFNEIGHTIADPLHRRGLAEEIFAELEHLGVLIIKPQIP